jgi:MFS-type transporter involved in bile tolerance (Atg22 family)
MMQFTAQALFLLLVVVIAIVFGFNDVHMAQLSQGINVVWISIGFYIGWKMLPDVPSRHKMHESHSLWTEGFKQVWRTTKSINRNYPHGLRWFLLASIFFEAGSSAFTTVSVIYMDAQLQMSVTEIGIVFFITLVASVPGSKIGSKVTKRTNPNTSLKINMVVFSVVTFAGAFALSGPDRSYLAYVWGVMWGFILGYDDNSDIIDVTLMITT